MAPGCGANTGLPEATGLRYPASAEVHMDYFTKMTCACMDEITKIAQVKRAGVGSKAKMIGLLGGGGALALLAERANRDRRMGRQMRMQQGGYGY